MTTKFEIFPVPDQVEIRNITSKVNNSNGAQRKGTGVDRMSANLIKE